jgi:RHS repeat-associated protein
MTLNGTVLFSYHDNTFDRLVQVDDVNGAALGRYYDDPFGRRLWKTVDNITTYFQYADEGLIGEFDAGGAAIRTYGYLPGTSAPLFLNQNGEYSWYRTDRLGTPHTLVESNGNVVWSGVYDAFGNVQIGTETITNNLRFAGQYYDAETGLHYNLNRYYDPRVGRYTQIDPLGDGLNPYVYVGGNPVNAIDPEGLCALRMFSGMTETFVGYGFVNSGVFLVPGTLMMINGMDEAVAGLWGLWTGQPTRSVWENALYAAIPNETVASSVHFASQLAISASPVIGEFIGDFGRYSRRVLTSETGAAYFGWMKKGAKKVGHHVIPQYMGGRKDQILTYLDDAIHTEYHEFLDNWKLPKGMRHRSPAPDSFRGTVRPWGRENTALRYFAAQSQANRKFIVENLRESYQTFGIYDAVMDVFDDEAKLFIRGY